MRSWRPCAWSLTTRLMRRPARPHGEPRFKMLETIREYALDRFQASGTAEDRQRRHTGYHLALAERADPELRGARQKQWLDRLEPEHNNMRAALARSRSAP